MGGFPSIEMRVEHDPIVGNINHYIDHRIEAKIHVDKINHKLEHEIKTDSFRIYWLLPCSLVPTYFFMLILEKLGAEWTAVGSTIASYIISTPIGHGLVLISASILCFTPVIRKLRVQKALQRLENIISSDTYLRIHPIKDDFIECLLQFDELVLKFPKAIIHIVQRTDLISHVSCQILQKLHTKLATLHGSGSESALWTKYVLACLDWGLGNKDVAKKGMRSIFRESNPFRSLKNSSGLKLGRMLWDGGDFQASLKIYHELLEDSPENSLALINVKVIELSLAANAGYEPAYNTFVAWAKTDFPTLLDLAEESNPDSLFSWKFMAKHLINAAGMGSGLGFSHWQPKCGWMMPEIDKRIWKK